MSLFSKIIYVFFYKPQYFILKFLGFDMEWFSSFYGNEVGDSLNDLYSKSFDDKYSFRNYVRFWLYTITLGFFFFYFFYLYKGIFYDVPHFANERWVVNRFDYYMNMQDCELLELKKTKKHIYEDIVDAREAYNRWLLESDNFEKNISRFTKIFFILALLFYHPLFEFMQIK